MALQGRNLILGIGGGISAYKSAELLRRLQDIGFSIQVIPTVASLNFVGAATWEALSGNVVATNLWSNVHDVPHIKFAERADLIVIAPTTADLLAKLANGQCDDLLTNVISASSAPLVLIPAMHPQMWLNAATQANVSTLRERGHLVIEPDEGRMTGDDYGVGRYPEVSKLIAEISNFADIKSDLLGRKVLVTAGGTREAIDPVRYIGNNSSGKQGISIAIAARNRGAEVALIAANISKALLSELEGIRIIEVSSTQDLKVALDSEFDSCQILLMTAAVADAKPIETASEKIKKADFSNIALEKNSDLLAELGAKRRDGQVLVAFAAETGAQDLAAANAKLLAKGAQILYLNDVSGGAIFGSDETCGYLLQVDEPALSVARQSKDTLADLLLDRALTKLR